MLIPEKYLIGSTPETKLPEGVSESEVCQFLKCKFCHREFMVPAKDLGKVIVKDVCENSDCTTSYNKEQMAAKLAEIKAATGETVKKLESNFNSKFKKELLD